MTWRPRHVALAMLVALAAPALPARQAHAQDRPVVFIHGIKSNGEGWRETADRLQQRLRITALRPTTTWYDWFENQANDVQGFGASLPNSTIAIGHSNGGLVSRQWSKMHALGGIITLGTPHEGALLASRALEVANVNADLFNVTYVAAAMLSEPNGDIHGWQPFLASSLAWATTAATLSLQEMVNTLGLTLAVPVLGQMAPGSAFLNEINSSSNLSREASAVAKRVGMVFVAHEYWKGGIAVGVAPEYQDWYYYSKQSAIVAFEAGAALLVANYPPWHWRAQTVAQYLRTAASRLRTMDPLWCWAVTDDASCATSHDGVVATPSQFYPGGQNLGFIGSAHLQEKRHSEDLLYSVLTADFGIEPRAGVPPPGGGGGGGGGGTGAGVLPSGQRLTPGQELQAAGGGYLLAYQGDGNLVLYNRAGQPVWSSGTVAADAGSLEMQGDGNLVIYSAQGQALWNSGTHNYPGAYLQVRDDGTFVVIDPSGAPVWWSGGR